MNDLVRVIGAGGGGGKGGSVQGQIEDDLDNLRSTSYALVVDAVSEGEIEGLVDGLKSVYLDGTAIVASDGAANFKGVTVYTRNGTQGQPHIPGLASVEAAQDIGVEVKQNLSVTRTIMDSDVDAVKITISIPQLTQTDTSSGASKGTSVTYAIDLQSFGGTFREVLRQEISGKTTSTYERMHTIRMTGSAPWSIRVRRITADSTSERLQNKTYWGTMVTVIDAKLRYPNTALVAMSIDASQFNSIPRRGYLMKMLRVKIPNNYNPITRVYSGMWDGGWSTAWTNNPAWCLYDLLTNARYGLGAYLNAQDVDKWGLYAISQYCDELVPDGFGGMEPRFTCNAYVQTKADAYKLLNDFVSIFRGMLYWQQGRISVIQDAPADPVQQYTNANVIDGDFRYSGTSRRDRPNVVLVTWNDPGNQYKQEIEYVEDQASILRFGIVQKEVTAFGCTSRGQAHRLGRAILLSPTESVEFKTAMAGAIARPGNIIQVADANRAGVRHGGRVRSVDMSTTPPTIELDSAITVVAGGKLSLVTPSGVVESRDISSSPGTKTTIQTATSYSFAVEPATIWMYSQAQVQPALYRVMTVSEDSDGLYKIVAANHDPSKYDAIDKGYKLEPRITSTLSTVPDRVTGVVVSEYLHKRQGAVQVAMTISWVAPRQGVRFRPEYRLVGGNWAELPETSSVSVDIPNVVEGDYQVRVRAVSALGLVGAYSDVYDYTVVGKTAPPQDVTGLSWALEPFGVRLKWDAAADVDLDSYELRIGQDWSQSVLLSKLSATTYLWGVRTAGTHYVMIKALDTSGNYSTSATSIAIPIASPTAPNVVASIRGQDAVLDWSPSTGAFVIDRYEIRYGATWGTAAFVATTRGSTFREKATFLGSRVYWVVAVDAAGNYGTPESAEIVVSPPTVGGVTAEVVDNNVLLKWAEGASTLPIMHYIVKKGAVYESATEIGSLLGRFSSVFEQAGGVYTYWIVPIDTAGNVGIPASISAAVSQPPDFVLRYDQNSVFSGVVTNAIVTGDAIAMPYVAQTWAQHFASNGWTTPQQQVDAGYPLYFQPLGVLTGKYEEEIDYGAVIQQGTTITVTPTLESVGGTVSWSIDIMVRQTATSPWVQYTGLSSVFATNFQFVKYRINATASSNKAVLRISNINVRMSFKRKSESGAGYALATDVGGTPVTLTTGFIDVESLVVTAAVAVNGSSITANYDFLDQPYPTSFKVLLFNSQGHRVSGAFSWKATGV